MNNIKFDKKFISVIAVYAIILVLYIVAFLIIPFPKYEASWIMFVFTIFATLVSLVVCARAFFAKETTVSKLYGYSIFRIGVIYALAQFIFGIVICIISVIATVPYWISLLVCLFLLGATLAGVIITDNTRDIVEQVEEATRIDIESLTTFRMDIESIAASCENAELKAKLDKLSEAFRFSDPVSNAKTKDIEAKLVLMLEGLKALVAENNVEQATELTKKISDTLAERNRICKASK